MVETRFDPYPYLEVSQINGHIRTTSLGVTRRFDPYPHISGSAHTYRRFCPPPGSTWINKYSHSTPSSSPKKSTNDGCLPSCRCVDPSRRQPTMGSYPPVQKRPKDCVNEFLPVLLPWCLVVNGRNRYEFVSRNWHSAEVSSVKHSFEGLFRSEWIQIQTAEKWQFKSILYSFSFFQFHILYICKVSHILVAWYRKFKFGFGICFIKSMSMHTQLHVSCVTPYQYWVYFSNEQRSRIKLWKILNCVFACIIRLFMSSFWRLSAL